MNLFIYLNSAWREEWGGHLELWSKDLQTCAKKYYARSSFELQMTCCAAHVLPGAVG